MKLYLILLIGLLFNQLLLAQIPAINTFSPASGPVGTTVTITGNNFSATTANNIVFLGAVRATVITAAFTSLTVMVPAGATYQPITVTTNSLTAYSAMPFTVTFSGGGNGFTASSFAPKIDYASGKGPACIASADFDGDGKPDLVAVNDTANTFSVFRNLSTTGAISLSPKIDFITGNKPYSVTCGDLDGDGKPDIAVANGAGNTVSIFRNASTGAGDISFTSKIDLPSGTFPFCVVICDFDGDGKPDLASTSSNNTVSIFKNNSSPGAFSFSPKADFVTGVSPYWIAVGDFDGDGKPELATANGINLNWVSVLRNTSTSGNISFAPKVDFDGGAYAFSIMTGDINGDGKLDLTVVGENSGYVSVMLNRSNGAGNISFAPQSNFSAGGSSFGVSLADMDGDGKPDIVAANSSLNSVAVLRNSSLLNSSGFDQQKVYTVGTNPWVSAVVDLDGDGKPDIATANERSANISVLKNTVSDLSIQSFSPSSAGKGTTVTINGLNFAGITGVSFGGIPAASFTVNSSTTISAVVDTGASGNVTVTRNDGTAFMPGFTYLPVPKITSFTPTTAGSGDTITINGINFPNIISISFGGVQASSSNFVSSIKIITVVGAGASGDVSYTSIAGTALLSGFIYDNTPSITSIIPNNAPVGTMVSITGKHFTGTNSVTFGGIPATSFTVVSPTNITAIVGAGASGNVLVTNSAGSASIGGFTYIPPPFITSFSPVATGPLEPITITGINFNGATKVTFGDVPAASFTVNSNTLITAIVAGGSSGKVKVTANGSIDSLAGFRYISPPVPVINSFYPVSGPVGAIVTITGENFSPYISNNIVYFGAVKAEVLTASTTLVTVKAPAGTTYQPISVTTNKNLIAYASQPFIITFPANMNVFTTNSFAKIDFSTPDLALGGSVVVHDLNGDNKLDIIFFNSSPGFSIFKNISNGSIPIFSPQIDYYIGYTPGKVSVGDLDGDGRPDLIVTVSHGGRYSNLIYRNISSNGNILFNLEVSLDPGANYKGIKIEDFDGDGKPDLTSVNTSNATFSIFRNVSTVGKIAFAASAEFLFYRGLDIATGDIDGDKKADIVITNSDNNTIAIYRNTSSPELLSFANKIEFNVKEYPSSLSLADLNGDGKTDIAVVNYNDSSFSVFKNTSTAGAISFEAKKDYRTMVSPGQISFGDLDGDSKPDLIIGSTISSKINGIISVFKNVSSAGQILFATHVDYSTGGYTPNPVAGDMTGDGKLDIVTTNYNTISILKNRIGEVKLAKLCPPLSNTSITSNIMGANYQWQANTGSGYINISNNSNYSGSNTTTLQLNSIPSSWYGYKYSCVVDGNNSDAFELQFADTWTGSVSSAWENPSNWSCGAVPDYNTDVIINSGTIVINSNVTIRSLKVNPGATVTVNAGFKLTVLH